MTLGEVAKMKSYQVIPLVWAAVTAVILLWMNSIIVDCAELVSRQCDTQIWESWRGFWRLEWIYRFKELIAGILAAVAGLSAIAAVRLQLTAHESGARAQRVERTKTALAMLQSEFARAMMIFGSGTAYPAEADLQVARSSLAALGDAHPGFLPIFMNCITATNGDFESMPFGSPIPSPK